MDNKDRSFMRGRDTEPLHEKPRPQSKVILTSLDEADLDESSEIPSSVSQVSCNSPQSSLSALVAPTEMADVYLRIRPLEHDAVTWKFRIENDTFIAANIENATSKNKNIQEQHYKFSHVFDDFSSQTDIYNKCVKPLVSLDDNATIMVYGTSGSGKTHTLLGEPYNPGLLPRALSQLFVEFGNNISTCPVCKLQNGIPRAIADDQIFHEGRIKIELLNSMDESQSHVQMLNQLKAENNFEAKFIENCQLFVWVSFVEIYNEDVYDLLTPETTDDNKENNSQRLNVSTKRKNLKVISNNGQPFVQGATQIFVRTFEETIKFLQYGMNRVSTGSTTINERSSRSHCIFFVDIIKWSKNLMTSKSYKFCDLAGSERLKKTENMGKRLKEAKNINKSLMTLGRCLVMANERQKNKSSLIPYRDSKLTLILQNALLGHEKISLIVNLNPKLEYIEENLNVLNFASIAKEIITKPKEDKNSKKTQISRYSLFLSSMSRSTTTNDYQQQIDDLLDRNFELENEISRLHSEMVEQEIVLRKSIVAAFEEDYQRTVEQFERQIAAVKTSHKGRIDHLEMCLKQKDKNLKQKNKMNEKLLARIEQLESLNGVYVCSDDSETESDETDTSDEND